MILITTALMIEAQPLKAELDLAVIAGESFPVFKNDEIIMVVTGTGAARAAAATGWALGRFAGIMAAVNIGFAGASERVADLNKWYCINSIRDESTGRCHIPDRLWDFHIEESPLLTVGKVVSTDNGWDGLIDMEGSGFYEAARQILSPDRIVLFKWVSDPLTGRIDLDETKKHFNQAVRKLVPVIISIKEASLWIEQSEPVLLGQIRERIRLTKTQQQYLRKWVIGYVKRGGDPEIILKVLPDKPPGKKPDNNRLFEDLKNALKG